MTCLDDLRDMQELLSEESDLSDEIEECVEDDEQLEEILQKLMEAADLIDEACALLEPHCSISDESLDDLETLTDELDEAGLTKEASAIEELLLTVGSKGIKKAYTDAAEKKYEDLKKKYRDKSLERAYPEKKISKEVEAAINELNKKIKKYRPQEAPLSSRYSPDMPGVQLIHIGDSAWQCPITGKVFDYTDGFTTASGNVVPGTSVENQTQHAMDFAANSQPIFSTRDQIINER